MIPPRSTSASAPANYGILRNASNQQKLWKDGIAISTGNVNSTALMNENFSIGDSGGTRSAAQTVSMVVLGRQASALNADALMVTFLTSIGAI